jgi:hypothetical protein
VDERGRMKEKEGRHNIRERERESELERKIERQRGERQTEGTRE